MLNIQQIATIRKKELPSTRPLSEGFEEVGVSGEMFFSKLTNLPIDENRYAGGDKGIDFTLPRPTIDVKTARKPFNLIVEEGKVNASIYVLIGIDEKGHNYFVGWEWGKNVQKASKRDFGYGIINHYIQADKLKKIDILLKVIKLFKSFASDS